MPQIPAPKRRPRRSTVLVVGTDTADRAMIVSCVRLTRSLVNEANDPESAEKLSDRPFDLIVWDLPPRDHQDSIDNSVDRLSQGNTRPLILVGDLSLAQAHLDGHVDQILPKPFMPSILVAAVKSALGLAPSSLMDLGGQLTLVNGLVFDTATRSLQLDGLGASFTRLEWQLLGILADHHGQYLTAQDIRALGWRAGQHEADQLRIYVSRLRQKLTPLRTAHLTSARGLGYRLAFDSDANGRDTAQSDR